MMDYSKFICHRKPERSFHVKKYQFPVCARCTGFYISLIIYFTYAYYFYIEYTVNLLLFAVLLLIPVAIDGLTQYYYKRESNNLLRLITGLIGGFGVGIIIKALKYYIFIKYGGI